jgi:hypothetical protein
MKKLHLFTELTVCLASIILLVFSVNVVNASLWDDIFKSNSQTELPYCQNWNCWLEEWIKEIEGSGINWVVMHWTASEYIQKIVVYLLSFLALVAVLIIIYAWVNILTSAGDDERVKKSTWMIKYAIIWLVIIFLAYPITTFVIWVFNR